MTEHRALPHSEETERAVLAAALLDGAALNVLAMRLRPEDFYLERHSLIYGAMLDLEQAGSPIDLRTVQERLERSGSIDNVGGLAYLATLDLDLPDVGRLDTYVDIVRDLSRRRQLVRELAALTRNALGASDSSASEIAAAASAKFMEIASDGARTDLVPICEALSNMLDGLDAGQSAHNSAIPTGFPDLDDVIIGWRPRRVYIVGGRTGAGKTIFALNTAKHAAMHGKRVAIISLEMGADELAVSVLAAEARIDSTSIQRGFLSQNQWREAIAACKRLAPATLEIDDSGGSTLQEVCAKVSRLRAERGVDLVIVDYLQLMTCQGGKRRPENRTLELAEISRGLKNLARSENIAVIALSQLSRESAKRSDPRPELVDLRESGSIEQDADLVAFVHRPEMFEPANADLRGRAELLIKKHRGGKLATLPLFFDAEHNLFRSMARAGVVDPF